MKINLLNNTVALERLYSKGILQLMFLEEQGLPFIMDKLTARVVESSHNDIILDFDNDISKTAKHIFDLQEIFSSTKRGENKFDDTDLGEHFQIEGNTLNVLGFEIRRLGVKLSKDEIKEKLIQKVFNYSIDEYKNIIKMARTKKGDEIVLPFNATEHEKILYLALKTKESTLYDFAKKINKELNLYRQIRTKMSNNELQFVDEKVHGFKRTGVDGIIQQSTWVTENEIKQIASQHQKDPTIIHKLKKIQKLLAKTSVEAVEIDPDDDLDKFINLLNEFESLTVNTKDKFILKTRKLGNYASKGMTLFGLYFPSFSIIAVDPRDPSALIHEATHGIDYKNDFVSDDIRSQFVNNFHEILRKQYYHNITLPEYIENSLLLDREPEIIQLLSDELTKHNPTMTPQRLKNLLSNNISDKQWCEDFILNHIDISETKSKQYVRELLNDFNNRREKLLEEYNIDGYHISNEMIRYQKLSRHKYGDEPILKEIETQLKNNTLSYKTQEGIMDKPPHWHYLSNNREIIARAGEIGYLLAKYDYKGHSNQEELDEWILRVSRIQDAEIKEFKSVQGCHHIKDYILRNKEYFGFAHAKEDTLMALKKYYKPFFKPMSIYTIDNNNEIQLNPNLETLTPVPDSEILENIEQSARDEFEQIINSKKKSSERNTRNKKERKSFDKNKHPLSYLINEDEITTMILMNDDDQILPPKQLFNYIIEHFNDIGRTRLEEGINEDMINARMLMLSRIIANKNEYSKSTQQAIQTFINNVDMPKLDFVKQALTKDLGEVFPNTKIWGLRNRAGLQLPIELKCVDVGLKNEGNPHNINYESLNITAILNDRDDLRKHHARENSGDISTTLFINDFDTAEYKLQEYSDFFRPKLKNAQTKEEALLYYLSAIDKIHDVLRVNKTSLMESIPESLIEQVNIDDDILFFIADKSTTITHDDLIEIQRNIDEAFRQITYSPRNDFKIFKYGTTGFDSFNQNGLNLLFEKILENPKVILSKSHMPPKKLIEQFQSELKIGQLSADTEDKILKYFDNKKVNAFYSRMEGGFKDIFKDVFADPNNLSNQGVKDVLNSTKSFIPSLYLAERLRNEPDVDNIDIDMDALMEQKKKVAEYLSLLNKSDLSIDDYSDLKLMRETIVKEKIVGQLIDDKRVNIDEAYQQKLLEKINPTLFEYIKSINESIPSTDDSSQFIFNFLAEKLMEQGIQTNKDKIYKRCTLALASVLHQNGVVKNPFNFIMDVGEVRRSNKQTNERKEQDKITI